MITRLILSWIVRDLDTDGPIAMAVIRLFARARRQGRLEPGGFAEAQLSEAGRRSDRPSQTRGKP